MRPDRTEAAAIWDTEKDIGRLLDSCPSAAGKRSEGLQLMQILHTAGRGNERLVKKWGAAVQVSHHARCNTLGGQDIISSLKLIYHTIAPKRTGKALHGAMEGTQERLRA